MADSIDDILQKHLDGDLTESESLGLLNALQHDSELRGDLEELETIRELARESFHSVTVPAAQTEKLYGALGYSMPSEPVGVIPMWMRYGAVAAAASLITAGVMSIDSGDDNPAQPVLAKNSTPAVVDAQPENSSISTIDQNVPHAESRIVGDNANAEVNSSREADSSEVQGNASQSTMSDLAASAGSVSTQLDASQPTFQSNIVAEEQPNVTNSLVEHSIGLQNALAGQNSSGLDVHSERMTTIQASAPQFAPLEEANGAFSLAYRTLQSQSDIAVDVPTQAISQNYAVTIGYELNDNLSLVLEGGQEHFAQRFMTTTDAGRPVEIQQQPYVTWLTAGARYEMPLIKLNSDILISPFVQTSAGAAIQQGNGFMGRGVVGSVIQPLSWFKVMAGWEYSMFVYSTAAGNEQTVNTGLTIGGMIQLR